MTEVTLQLPDHLYDKVKQWAAITQQELDIALMDALGLVLTPVSVVSELEEPVANLADAELLEQAKMKMLPEQGRRLSRLLSQHREGRLSEEEHRELFALAQLYQRLWLRQSEALAEAVRRGLHPPLHS